MVFYNELKKIDTISDLNLASSGIENTINDFVRILELLLLEAMDEEVVKKAKQKEPYQMVHCWFSGRFTNRRYFYLWLRNWQQKLDSWCQKTSFGQPRFTRKSRL